MARRRNSVDDVTFGRAWLWCAIVSGYGPWWSGLPVPPGFGNGSASSASAAVRSPSTNTSPAGVSAPAPVSSPSRDVDLLARLGELAHRQVTERRPRSECPPGVGDAKERVHALQQTAKRAWVGAPGGPQLRMLKLVHHGHRDRCGEPAKCSGLGSWRPIGIPMRRAAFL